MKIIELSENDKFIVEFKENGDKYTNKPYALKKYCEKLGENLSSNTKKVIIIPPNIEVSILKNKY